MKNPLMRPSFSTRMRSACSTLETRWAMMILVVPGMCSANAARILASVAVSTALVESSRINTLGFFMLPMLSGVYESLRERVSPAVNSISWEELDGAADLHERILVGDDIVQLNRIEYGVREGERQAVLWVSSYDRIPGRKVYERLIETMLLQSERGETMYGEDSIRYSSCWGSSGSLYVHSGQHTVPLEEGDSTVTIS